MRTGIQTNPFAYLGSYDAQYARIRDLGYDAADVSISDIGAKIYRDTAAMEKHCKEVREAAARNGVEIFQVHGPWPTDDKTEESRKIVWECMHRAVYGTYLFGAKYLVIHPQMPYGWGSEEDADFSEKLTVELLRELMPDCEKYGVVLCLENMPMKAHRISVMKKIVEAVEQVDSGNIGICLDTGHSNVFAEDLGDVVRCAAPYLKVLHVHDNGGGWDEHLLPYLGSCNWDSFTKALAEVGYDGVMSLETGGPVSKNMPDAIRDQAERLTYMTAKYLADRVEAAR